MANPSELVNKGKQFSYNAVRYVGLRIMPAVVVFFVITALSFLFTKGMTPAAFSDRFFLVGMLVMGLGGIVIFAQMISSSGKIFFNNDRDPSEIKKILNPNPKSRGEVEHRYNVGGQIWLVGIVCMIVSALVTSLFG